MSKIYEALEKAEMERGEERKGTPPFIPEGREELKGEDQKLTPILSEAGGMVSDQSLIYFSQPGSLAAEQFRKLRTYLLRRKSSEFQRTIMVTSAGSGEGKSFVAANLAIGIAHDFQSHALLVDCDLRSPSLGRWFGLENHRGLSDYLTGDGNITELIVKTEVEKLSILPGGKAQDNPTELFGSKRMESLIHELKSGFHDRYVIFDSTPLLATAESEVLAKLVDEILIVVRAGVTPRETLKQAIVPLEKKKVLGFVLNDLEFKSSGLSSRYFGSDGYYYKYGDGYGRGKGRAKSQSRWRKIAPFKKKLS